MENATEIVGTTVYVLLRFYPEHTNNPAEASIAGVYTKKEDAYKEWDSLRGTKARYSLSEHKLQ